MKFIFLLDWLQQQQVADIKINFGMKAIVSGGCSQTNQHKDVKVVYYGLVRGNQLVLGLAVSLMCIAVK